MNARGFTMIELLLATAIAAMLMVAVLTVTASLGRTQAAVESTAAQTLAEANFQPIFDLIRNDLVMSKSVTVTGDVLRIETLNRLAIHTPNADNTAILSHNHFRGRGRRPTVVRYRLVDSGVDDQPPLLVREQIPVEHDDDDATKDCEIELLAVGVIAFEVTSADAPITSPQQQKPPNTHAITLSESTGIRIRFQLSAAPQPWFEQVIGGAP